MTQALGPIETCSMGMQKPDFVQQLPWTPSTTVFPLRLANFKCCICFFQHCFDQKRVLFARKSGFCSQIDFFVLSAGDAASDAASLRSLMQAVFTSAGTVGARALALPLLGGGSAGWSLPVAAKAIVAQVVNAANKCTLGEQLRVL